MQRGSKESKGLVATLLVVLFSMNQAGPIFLSHKHTSGYWNGLLFNDAKLKMNNFAYFRVSFQDNFYVISISGELYYVWLLVDPVSMFSVHHSELQTIVFQLLIVVNQPISSCPPLSSAYTE